MVDHSNFYKDILDHLYDGVYFVDRQRRITYWNKGAERITGYTGQSIMGSRCADNLLMHVNDQGVMLCQNDCPLSHTLEYGIIREGQAFLHHANGHRVPVLIRVAPICDTTGNITGAVETFSDNSSMIAALERVKALGDAVMCDDVTGVGNRYAIKRSLDTCLSDRRHHGTLAGVLFSDVDRFKPVNDTYGHDTGDRVLRMVANSLRHNLRATDVVGRWGGDEFVTVVPGVNLDQLTAIANKLRVLTSRSHFAHEGDRINVTISIGATQVRSEDTLASLIKRADQLLYQSKLTGGNRVTSSI